jgi:hypothetical protein
MYDKKSAILLTFLLATVSTYCTVFLDIPHCTSVKFNPITVCIHYFHNQLKLFMNVEIQQYLLIQYYMSMIYSLIRLFRALNSKYSDANMT